MWPESSSEASTSTARAMSSARRDLAQRHRARDPLDDLGVERAARHRRVRPARRDRVHAAARRDAHDLVLQAEQQADLDRRLRGGVVGVAGLAEPPGRRADEHEVAVPVPLDLAQERARREERRREVRAQRLPPSARAEAPTPARPPTATRRRPRRRRRRSRALRVRCAKSSSTCASSVRSAPSAIAPGSSAAIASARSRPRW